MKQNTYTSIIIGSGIAGLYTALKLEQQTQNCGTIAIITKSKLEDSNSYYAQGGMVAVLKENKTDSVASHISDTLKAGAGLSEENTIKFISENSDRVVKDLLTFGVDFDRDENGKFKLTKEAAHSVNRILHAKGDATGREIEIALCKAIRTNKNIIILENTTVIDLITDDNKCNGVVVLTKDKKYESLKSSNVILATGGLGQLYKNTTNPIGATGDGYALAYRAGADLQDMEFVQFHPTALAIDDKINHNRFLISEAVRGEGAKLCDKNGIEFMEKYHPQKELAPRDIVARAIYSEMEKTKQNNVYLNATIIGKEKLIKRFPTIYKKCLENNIDITTDFIPVAPCAHYFMGGIKTNLKGETSIKNLYAIGEVASTGLHGGNRLASNSLLECVVCAYATAQSINDKILDKKGSNFEYTFDETISNPKPKNETNNIKLKLQNIMWDNVGIYRDEKSLKFAQCEISKLQEKFNKEIICTNKQDYELRNMLTVAQIIVKQALNRKESRGAHFRIDFPKTNDMSKHSLINIKDKGEKFC